MADQQPLKPQDQTNYMLGLLDGKMSSLQQSIEMRDSAQAAVNAELRADANRALEKAIDAQREVSILRAEMPKKVSWIGVVGATSGILAIIVLIADRFLNS